MSGGGFIQHQEGSSVTVGDDLFDQGRTELPLQKRCRIAGVGRCFEEAVLVKLDPGQGILAGWRDDTGLPKLHTDGLTKKVGSMRGDEGGGGSVTLKSFEVEILGYVKDEEIALDTGWGRFAKQSPSPGTENLAKAPEEGRPDFIETIGGDGDRGLRFEVRGLRFEV